MKIYIEELEELSTHGVTTYSLITGMDMYRAEVRASGIELSDLEGNEIDDKEIEEELTIALNKEITR